MTTIALASSAYSKAKVIMQCSTAAWSWWLEIIKLDLVLLQI